MAPKRITESIRNAFAEAKVNRDGGFIDNVLICGVNSENGRDYPAEVLRRDHHCYEGRPVNCDHSREVTIDKRLGWFENVRPGNDGRPRGRFNVLKSHPMYEQVMEAAERNPSLFGFSHVAMCDTKSGADGRETIVAIRKVESIDLVADPATTKGLFESRGTVVPQTIKDVADGITKNPQSTSEQILKVKRLAEAHGTVNVAWLKEEDKPEEMDPKEATTSAFQAACHGHIAAGLSGEMEPKEVAQKIKKLLDAHGDATEEKAEPGEDQNEGDKGGKKESKAKPAIDPLAVLEDCRKQNINPTGAELKALCLMEAVDRAAWITDQRKKTEAEKPASGGRHPDAGPSGRKTESKNAPEVKDVKTFLEAIRA